MNRANFRLPNNGFGQTVALPGAVEVHRGFVPKDGGMGIAPGFSGLSITMSSALPEAPTDVE